MSVKVYPVTKTQLYTDDYEVKINGGSVPLNTARVSAVPYNRRWPGHQRSIDQSELINFLSLALDSPAEMEIIPKRTFTDVKIRPENSGIEHRITENGSILLILEKPQYFTVEPYGRHHALHIFADPMPEYSVDPDGDDVIYFGAGEHDVGMISLVSGQTLFIDEGAVVYACVKAFEAENIKIVGRGILDNSRNREKILYEAHEQGNTEAVDNAVRLHTVQLEYCRNIDIEGITIRDSLVYNIRPIACENLTIHNVKIIGCWRFNSDGIDMHNCADVLIENCFLRTFDDSICVKGFDCYYDGDVEQAVYDAMHYGGRVYDTFKNVRVRGCVIWNDWGKCLEIGAETRAEEICDVIFEDCDIIHVTSSILDCMNVDYADVHDIIYRKIRIELDEIIPQARIQTEDDVKYESLGGQSADYAPPLIDVKVEFHHEYSAGGTRRGRNYDILFEDIHICGEHKPFLAFRGYSSEFNCRDITVRGIYLNGSLLGGEQDMNVVKNEYCENIVIE